MTNSEQCGGFPARDDTVDHVLATALAEITLVEYGSYALPALPRANEEIAQLRDHFGDRVRYIFRHLPIAEVTSPSGPTLPRAPTPKRNSGTSRHADDPLQ